MHRTPSQPLRQQLLDAGCGEHDHTVTVLTLRGPCSLRTLISDAAHVCRVSANQLVLEAVLEKLERIRTAQSDPLYRVTSVGVATPPPGEASSAGPACFCRTWE
jgi:hypothetical protein